MQKNQAKLKATNPEMENFSIKREYEIYKLCTW